MAQERRPPVVGVDDVLAKVVEEMRGQHGWSQRVLAERMGISKAAYERYSGPDLPSQAWTVQVLIKAAEALGLTPAALLARARLSPVSEIESAIAADPTLDDRVRASLLTVVELARERAQSAADK